MAQKGLKITFEGSQGEMLAARLDQPAGPPKAYALFAHCFSCSKDIFAASRISGQLAELGIAVLRFDFTGLGQSGGDFANTNFTSNVQDLVKAADYLRTNYQAPKLLIGHSLGGAAVLMAAHQVPECVAVATLGAPADTEHVSHNFSEHIETIERDGEAEVSLGGRPFRIRQQFLEDVRSHKVVDAVKTLKRALLVAHAPLDQQVGVENAGAIFVAAKHPKSFLSLDEADHLITRKADAIYAANVLSAWAEKYIGTEALEARPKAPDKSSVLVEETAQGTYANIGVMRDHVLLGDQPRPAGNDTGPNPYEYVSMALGLCTSQTVRMYADRKGWSLDQVRITLKHDTDHVADCIDCIEGKEAGTSKVIRRSLQLIGDLDAEQRQRLFEIADKCPVHKMLEHQLPVRSSLED